MDTPRFSLNGLKTKATIIDVYDGDTVTALFPFKGDMYKWKCRLYGIDTPEIRKEKVKAIESRDFLRSLVLNKEVDLECLNFDKYGRVLVKIYTDKYINDHLVSLGYAKIYNL